jgi:hypothetical protein
MHETSCVSVDVKNVIGTVKAYAWMCKGTTVNWPVMATVITCPVAAPDRAMWSWAKLHLGNFRDDLVNERRRLSYRI